MRRKAWQLARKSCELNHNKKQSLSNGNQAVWHFISDKISETVNYDFICDDIRQVAGGDTHCAYKISDGKRRYFVKLNDADAIKNFASEANGLAHLAQANTIRIPRYICHGIAESKSFLVLEHITLKWEWE